MFWEPTPQAGAFKTGAQTVWFQASDPQGEVRVGCSLLTVRHCAGGGVYGKNVSQPSPPASMRVFSHLPNVEEPLS